MRRGGSRRLLCWGGGGACGLALWEPLWLLKPPHAHMLSLPRRAAPSPLHTPQARARAAWARSTPTFTARSSCATPSTPLTAAALPTSRVRAATAGVRWHRCKSCKRPPCPPPIHPLRPAPHGPLARPPMRTAVYGIPTTPGRCRAIVRQPFKFKNKLLPLVFKVLPVFMGERSSSAASCGPRAAAPPADVPRPLVTTHTHTRPLACLPAFQATWATMTCWMMTSSSSTCRSRWESGGEECSSRHAALRGSPACLPPCVPACLPPSLPAHPLAATHRDHLIPPSSCLAPHALRRRSGAG